MGLETSLSLPSTSKESESDKLSHTELDDETFFKQYGNLKPKDKANKNEPFPLKLYRILFEAKANNDDDIISFCPSGRSFMIHDIDDFVEKIMPKYFTSNRMSSFQRQLNLYGFRRRLRGEDKKAFYHESFLQGERNLCLTIKRKAQNFKIPPHLLPDRHEDVEPTPAIAEAKVNGRIVLGSPPLRPQSHAATPAFKSSSEETPRWDATASLRSAALMQSLTLLPPSLSPATSELLKLNRQLRLAKEQAEAKQQLAMAAIQRLVDRIDMR